MFKKFMRNFKGTFIEKIESARVWRTKEDITFGNGVLLKGSYVMFVLPFNKQREYIDANVIPIELWEYPENSSSAKIFSEGRYRGTFMCDSTKFDTYFEMVNADLSIALDKLNKVMNKEDICMDRLLGGYTWSLSLLVIGLICLFAYLYGKIRYEEVGLFALYFGILGIIAIVSTLIYHIRFKKDKRDVSYNYDKVVANVKLMW